MLTMIWYKATPDLATVTNLWPILRLPKNIHTIPVAPRRKQSYKQGKHGYTRWLAAVRAAGPNPASGQQVVFIRKLKKNTSLLFIDS